MDTAEIHQKLSGAISAIIFDNPETVKERLNGMSSEEMQLLFHVYHGLDFAQDVDIMTTIVQHLVPQRIAPKISGFGFIRAIKEGNAELLEKWSNLLQNVKVKDIFFKDSKKELIFALFETNLLKGNERIVELLMEFFKKHEIEFKISASLCDRLSKDNPVALQQMLNIAIKYDINVESNQSALKKYPETSRKIWKEYYTAILDD